MSNQRVWKVAELTLFIFQSYLVTDMPANRKIFFSAAPNRAAEMYIIFVYIFAQKSPVWKGQLTEHLIIYNHE